MDRLHEDAAQLRTTAPSGGLLLRIFARKQREPGPDSLGLAGCVVEATVLCLAALAFNMWFRPEDPFGVQAQFPWLWIVPSIITMRHGTSIGIWSFTVLLGAWLAMEAFGQPMALPLHADSTIFPKSYFVGGVVWILICGQFSDTWNERMQQVTAANAYFAERLQAITRSHFLLRQSHERLEQEMLSRPLTLRETLARLRDVTPVDREHGTALPGAIEFLQIAAQCCQLEAASLHRMQADGSLDGSATVQLGMSAELQPGDEMVRTCVEERRLAHLRNTERAGESSCYLACAPLLSSSGTLQGVLVVKHMSFFALNHDNLQLLAVLAGYYADGIEQERIAADVLRYYPACPQHFALDLVRLRHIQHDTGLRSALVGLVLAHGKEAPDLLDELMRVKRGIDLQWAFYDGARHVIVTLLPLCGPDGPGDYLLRITDTLQAPARQAFATGQVACHVSYLDGGTATEALGSLLEKCRA